ncbi:MAG: hypothetical protein H6742_16565 [Alphaproteobacteria bacterium]|nr:hypothetical protein [Alphaproteobacteria bacterium]
MPRLSRRTLLGSGLGLAALTTLPGTAHASVGRTCACGPALPLGERAIGAPTGSAFARQVTALSDHERYAAAVEQVLAGNVPAFLRPLTPVVLDAPDDHLGPRQATVFVTPDYVSIGSQRDFLRVPLDLDGAAHVADALELALPTPRIVDAVYRAAATRLEPAPMPPTAAMRSMPYVVEHQRLVEAERGSLPILPLLAGHKKDLVLTNRLRDMPDRVAIYGWHRTSGEPIQPLSLVHGHGYADYSHGVRLVHRMVLVDGQAMDYFDALADHTVAPLLTREGRLDGAQELLQRYG